MKNIFLTLLLFLSLNLSAQQNVKFVKQSPESLLSYLSENNVSFDEKDITTLKDINVFSYYNATDKLTVPEAYFFNRQGYRVTGYDGTSCGNEITGLKKINKKPFIKNETISDWTKNFIFLKPDDEDILNSGYDLFVIINWATFLPTMNEDSFNWYKSLKENKENKEYKIKIFLSNLDIQSNWQLNQAQKDALHLD